MSSAGRIRTGGQECIATGIVQSVGKSSTALTQLGGGTSDFVLQNAAIISKRELPGRANGWG